MADDSSACCLRPAKAKEPQQQKQDEPGAGGVEGGATSATATQSGSSNNTAAAATATATDAATDHLNQVALITGCASGIGRGTALAFAKLNYRLVLVDKQAERLSETAQLCCQQSSKNYKPLELTVDLSEGEQVSRQVVELTLKQFGRLDVLINNAGITALTKFDDSNCVQLYHKIIATNMHAAVYLCLAAYEPLKASRGSIVNVSSVLDDKPAKFKFAYCMSKAAITMLTKCLANDFSPHVRVNCVSPGPIASSILDDMGIKLDERRLNAKQSTLVNRIGEPEEVAKMIIYLSSKDKAAFITGSRVLVDGGYTLVPHEKEQKPQQNISGIKLRGASFLMHQVYDDEMTFKLVAAASNVSGLPVEVCLEEFGKHFLVYCQKNGYDQILRVLGSNLYDFLTNLDNLHDHLASIYPGMRAPSFRVTRHLNTNQQQQVLVADPKDPARQDPNKDIGYINASPVVESSLEQVSRRLLSAAADTRGDELHKQNASCSMAGSMYLHYYSERAGLSPIVKGLVMAVAKEFFQIDIQVTECELSGQAAEAAAVTHDDHVVLKIDKRIPAAAATADLAELETTKTKVDQGGDNDESCSVEMQGFTNDEIIKEAQQRQQQDQVPGIVTHEGDCDQPKQGTQTIQTSGGSQLAASSSCKLPTSPQTLASKTKATLSNAVVVNIYDSLSTNARDSLVNSEIMMQTFPFHVIFDRQFNLVQVGKSLLRVTSSYWQRWTTTTSTSTTTTNIAPSSMISGSGNDNQAANKPPAGQEAEGGGGQPQLVKFSDLFQIVRPKIEFTFDAIADHTNQVFVVKTRPLVLNADFRRHKRLSSTDSTHSTVHSNSSNSGSLANAAGAATDSTACPVGRAIRPSPPPPPLARPMCPMDRIARARRRSSLGNSDGPEQPTLNYSPTGGRAGETNPASQQQQHQAIVNNSMPSVLTGGSLEQQQQPRTPATGSSAHNLDGSPKHRHSAQQLDELDDLAISLRLKGQMIILLGGQLCLFLCSPRVDHLDQLMECGVRMSDFALHDRARELMLMSHTHKEDREAVKKLDQASNDLKKMDTKLRQENKRTNEVLHNIFPAKIATMLSHGNKVESESFDLVTCLYSDIIGFTKMCGSENVRPIDIVRLLNTLYLQFDNLTNIHGVFKVETIGDAYVVVGGLPEPVEDHADRCVKMGLDMVKVISTVRSPADNQPIQMRIGIHSGPVMAGIVGIRVPRYSLFGNTTTLANQLETNGVGGKIHISDFTLKNLINRDKFVIEDNPNVISSVPFVTYFVTNYIGDQVEMMNHERILEEQLIKDFELMGNEVELVDDSYHQQLVYAYGGDGPAASNKQISSARGPRKNPIPLLSGGSCAQGISGDDDLMCGESSHLTQPRNEQHSGGDGCGSSQPGAGRAAGSRRPLALGESLAGDDQHEQYDRLILMDIEDQDDEVCRLLGRLSNQLSSSIISEALRQVSSSLKVDRDSKLVLALILDAATASESSGLEIIVRHQFGGEIDILRPQQHATSGNNKSNQNLLNSPKCPVCQGCGSLDEVPRDLVRLRLRGMVDGEESSGMESEPVRALCAWLSDRLTTKHAAASARASIELDGATGQVNSGSTTTTNCESLLAEVRAERYKIECLLRQTETVSPQVVAAVESGRSISSRHHEPSQRPQTTNTTDTIPSTMVMGQNRSLSNEIQRIKRMDTLKCQRLKRKRQQQQQQQQHLQQVTGGGPERDELELEPKRERPAPEDSEPIDEEPEEEEDRVECIVDDDDCGHKQTGGVRMKLHSGQAGWRKCDDNAAEQPKARIPEGGRLPRHQQREVAATGTETQKPSPTTIANAAADTNNNNQSNYQSFRSSLVNIVNGVSQRAQNRKHRFNLNPFAHLTSSFVSPFSSPIKQQRKEVEEDRHADLTSTMQHQLQQQQRVIITTSTSPSTLANSNTAREPGKQAPTGGQFECSGRKQSSRSQNSSGGSAGSANINAAAQQQPGAHIRQARKSSNCSCLKSSASSQSISSG